MAIVVTDRPYEFVPLYRGTFRPSALRLFVPRYLERSAGVAEVEYRGLERLQECLAGGHGLLLAAGGAPAG